MTKHCSSGKYFQFSSDTKSKPLDELRLVPVKILSTTNINVTKGFCEGYHGYRNSPLIVNKKLVTVSPYFHLLYDTAKAFPIVT